MTSFLKSFVHAGRGIAAGAACRNFRVMLGLGAAAAVTGVVIGLSPVEWALAALAAGLVLAAELINTAGEVLVDLVQPEHDPRAGRIKDLLAGASLAASLAALAAALAVVLPRLLAAV